MVFRDGEELSPSNQASSAVLDLPDQLTANFKTFDIKSMSQFESHTECVLPSKGRIFAKHKQLTMLLCLVTLA